MLRSQPRPLSAEFDAAAGEGARSRTALRILLAGLSGFLLCVPWLNNELYWVGWVAWLPLLAALRDRGPRAALFLGWFAGTLCFAGGSYWLAEFMTNLKQITPVLSILLAGLFWCYLGLTLGLACMLY